MNTDEAARFFRDRPCRCIGYREDALVKLDPFVSDVSFQPVGKFLRDVDDLLKNVLRWEYRVRLVSCFLPSVIAVRKDRTSSGDRELKSLSSNLLLNLEMVDP